MVETVDRSDLVHVQTPQGFPRAALRRRLRRRRPRSSPTTPRSSRRPAAPVVDRRGRAARVQDHDPVGSAPRRAAARMPAAASARVRRRRARVRRRRRRSGSAGCTGPTSRASPGTATATPSSTPICDALLSAAGLGDIGGRFGIGRSAVRGRRERASSCARRSRWSTGAGFRVGNVAVQVIANRPRLAPRRTRAGEPSERAGRRPGERRRDHLRRSRIHRPRRGAGRRRDGAAHPLTDPRGPPARPGCARAGGRSRWWSGLAVVRRTSTITRPAMSSSTTTTRRIVAQSGQPSEACSGSSRRPSARRSARRRCRTRRRPS